MWMELQNTREFIWASVLMGLADDFQSDLHNAQAIDRNGQTNADSKCVTPVASETGADDPINSAKHVQKIADSGSGQVFDLDHFLLRGCLTQNGNVSLPDGACP